MELKCIYGINYDSNIYVINGEKPSIIDTGTGLHHKRVINEIKKYIDIKKINQIILTHEHFDHTGGIEKLKNDTSEDVKIISHKKAATKIEKGESHFAKMLGAEMNCITVDIKLEEGDKIQIGDKQWNVLSTPGHTPGSISLYEETSKSLISGDTIFSNGSFGRYDLPGGDPYLLKKSIARLSNLDIKNLYPGHENIVENYAKSHIEKTLQNINYML